jgi:hypothetical protein
MKPNKHNKYNKKGIHRGLKKQNLQSLGNPVHVYNYCYYNIYLMNKQNSYIRFFKAF